MIKNYVEGIAMDITETYIKMCEKAVEIQNQWSVGPSSFANDYAYVKTNFMYKWELKNGKVIYEIEKRLNKEWVEHNGGVIGFRILNHGEKVTDDCEYLHENSKITREWVSEGNPSWPSSGCYRIEDCIWLPHQSQLQDMVLKYSKQSPLELAVSFGNTQYELLFNNRIQVAKFPERDTSMEQLWLAFVMKERYSKVWNGEDWIK